MKKFLLAFVFLFSFVAFSFADMVPYVNGSYLFETTEHERVAVVVKDYDMSLIFGDGSVIDLKLNVDAEDNYYYFYTDGDNWILVFFDDACYGAAVTSDSKYGNYNMPDIFDSIANLRTKQEGVFLLHNLHFICR